MAVSNKEIQQILEKYPTLSFDEKNRVFSGILELYKNDAYEIEISNIDQFPNQFPMVKETGERIPHKADRHIYQSTLTCCFTTPTREKILLKTRIQRLIDFMDYIVVPFFQNNSYYEIKGEYSQGEYSHVLGILEGYFDILGIEDLFKVLNVVMLKVDYSFTLKPTSRCYCGSGEKLKKCGRHRKHYREFLKIGDEQMKKDYLSISSTILASLVALELLNRLVYKLVGDKYTATKNTAL